MSIIIGTGAGIVLLLYLILIKPNASQKNKSQSTYSTNIIHNDLASKQDDVSINPEALQREIPIELKNFHLILPKATDQQAVNRIVDITKNVARPHPILKALTRDISSEELYELLLADAEIAAKLLQTVNSAAFYLEQKIVSLNYAIVYMGMNLVRDIALKVALSSMESYTAKQNEAFKNIWAAGFLGSCISTLLAKNLNLQNPTELATQTLLCLIGDIAIVSYQPHFAELYTSNMSFLERITIEQEELGTNAALIGEKLAIEWELPNSLTERICYSLMPLAVPPHESQLTGDTLQSIVFSYTAARISDFIILQNDAAKLGEIKFLGLKNPEFFYLPDYLQLTGLTKIENIIQTPSFIREVNQFITRILR